MTIGWSRFLWGGFCVAGVLLSCGESHPELFTNLDFSAGSAGVGGVNSDERDAGGCATSSATSSATCTNNRLGLSNDAGTADATGSSDGTPSSGEGTSSQNSPIEDAGTAEAGAQSPSPDASSADVGPAASVDPFFLPPEQRPDSDGSCPSECEYSGGRCAAGICVFDCDSEAGCQEEQTVCPPNLDCNIRCGNGSCTDNIVCREGAYCQIECAGNNSCPQEVICEGACSVVCSGDNSCAGGIGGSVESLDLQCTGTSSCGSIVSCEGQQCNISCSGEQSCPQVDSYGSGNLVECTGDNSCAQSVYCSGTSCQVNCAEGACTNGFVCQALSCGEGAFQN